MFKVSVCKGSLNIKCLNPLPWDPYVGDILMRTCRVLGETTRIVNVAWQPLQLPSLYWLTFVQFMACCLTAPSHYLEPMLINLQWSSVAFIWGQFCRKCSWYLSLIWVWKLLIQDLSPISQGQCIKNSVQCTSLIVPVMATRVTCTIVRSIRQNNSSGFRGYNTGSLNRACWYKHQARYLIFFHLSL